MGMKNVTNVTLRVGEMGKRGQLYDVLLDGEPIVSGSRDPEHDAARALLARGITGTMQTVGEDGSRRMRLDIEKAAPWAMTERDRGSIGCGRWFPYARSDRH